MLVVAWHLEAERMAEFSRQGFVNGWTKLKCDSVEKMRAAIPGMRQSLADDLTFKEVYSYAFNFGRMQGQKSLGRFLDGFVNYEMVKLTCLSAS